MPKIDGVSLNDEHDKFVWKLMPTGQFSVKSMYADLINGHTRFLRKYLWNFKIPLKIKVFMWFLNKWVLLTRDNLAKRNWHGSKKCCFCDAEETVEHLFLSCPFARLIWRIVNSTY